LVTYSVNWSDSATLDDNTSFNPAAIPLFTTTYFATVTSSLGCQKVDSVTVNLTPPPPLVLLPGNSTVCAGTPLNFDIESTCDYTLKMYDLIGDGWNGQALQVFENGAMLGIYTVPNGQDSNIVNFTVTNGSNISLVYNSGGGQSESSFDLIDGTGASQFSVATGGMI